MARFRTIDPKLWQHPFFRKQPWFVRDVFIFLFSSHADDEGRFVADAFAILEGAFSRNHPVTEDDVEEALDALVDGGLIIRYDGKWGFLLGWYEHQFIDRRYRQPSSLPPPPLKIGSWDAAEAIRQQYAKAQKIDPQRAQFQPALRWSMQNHYQDAGNTREQHECNTRDSRVQHGTGRERKGKEGKGSTTTTLTPSVPSATADTTQAEELKAETTKQRQQRKIVEERKLLDEFDEEERELLDDYIACADEGLKTGTTVGGRVARLKALVKVANEVNDPDSFRYGLHQANQARVANPNYVKKAALSKKGRRQI